MYLVGILLAFISVTIAQDYPDVSDPPIEVITRRSFLSLPRCPRGHVADMNGVCREVWGSQYYGPSIAVNSRIAEVIKVPPNCPPGQQPDPNGVCREVWRSQYYGPSMAVNSRSVIDAPPNCVPPKVPDDKGVCREVWRSQYYGPSMNVNRRGG